MAEALGDRAALAVCRAYHGVGTKWAGDLVRGNELLVAALPELHRQVPGSWYTAMMICEQAYSYLHAGRSTAAIEHVRANSEQLARTNNLMFRYNTRSVLFAEMMVTGEGEGAADLWMRLEGEYAPLARTIYVRLARCIATLEVLVDREETGAAVDEAVTAFQDLVSEDYYSNAARVLIGYARLLQFQKARPAERAAARRRLESATRSLRLRALVPVFQCHVFVWRAVLARSDGNFAAARRLLERAAELADACQSRRGLFHVALERARLARQSGDQSSTAHAADAIEVASSERWRVKIRAVRAEFGIRDSGHSMLTSAKSAVGVSRSSDQARRYAEALLQVSLATASTLDSAEVAKNALTELSRVLGAERALLFLIDPASGKLVERACTGAGAESVSGTVVRRVVASRAPVILTGTDDGEVLTSESIVTFGLRSIIAAPLIMRERLIGVVYLDSRLAKGMFTEDDVNLLLGVSNHIAIAVETANLARVEAERAALRRDIELVGTIQNLLLPKAATFSTKGLHGVGFNRPTSQCGGDWWWYEVEPDGSLLILLGDVSGHGAAPAMITSSIAGAFHALRAACPRLSPQEVLAAFDRRMRDFGGDYHMTMCIVRVDPSARTLRVWNAAAPPLFVLRASGSECITSAGHLLGESEGGTFGERTVSFGPGDRVLMCTDGLLELTRANGRQLGPRRVSQAFSELADTSLESARTALIREIEGTLSGRDQEDDITFVVIEAIQALDAPNVEASSQESTR